MADFWTAVQIQKSKTEHFFLTLSNPSLAYVCYYFLYDEAIRPYDPSSLAAAGTDSGYRGYV